MELPSAYDWYNNDDQRVNESVYEERRGYTRREETIQVYMMREKVIRGYKYAKSHWELHVVVTLQKNGELGK